MKALINFNLKTVIEICPENFKAGNNAKCLNRYTINFTAFFGYLKIHFGEFEKFFILIETKI